MKIWKFAVAAVAVLGIYSTTVAFTPDNVQNPNCNLPTMVFKTDCYNDVVRVADMLNEEQMNEVNQLNINIVKIIITTKKKESIVITDEGSSE